MTSTPAINGLFPISTVSELTGVNAITLRAWERRYGLINPTRTEAGHRLYSRSDIEHIKAILQLLDTGITISRVTDAMQQTRYGAQATTQDDGPWQRYTTNLLKAIAEFDEATLETLYNEAMSLYPVDLVTRQLLLPLLKILGERWMNETAGVAEEHFFSIFMRNKLGSRFHHRNLHNTGPRIVAACLPGEQHVFGLLLFALSAHARGYRIILLGADMPLAQLPEVVRRTQSKAIVLSGSIEAVNPDIDEDLSALESLCKVPICIGGSYAYRRLHVLEDLGLYPLGDDLSAGLHTLAQLLASSPAR
jgi:MerR family transcriptional regulator, light-induced transcriptional regulator